MKQNYPSPCDKCPRNDTKQCDYRRCEPWLIRYRYRQKQINAYARKVLPGYLASKEGDVVEQ